MKYYIEFPIGIFCNLKCDYCFHSEAFELESENKFDDKYLKERPFTFQQYMNWRDKHLSDGSEYICELHGGEMSHPKNQQDVLNIIDIFDKEIFQLQTNGLGDRDFYGKLSNYRNKINRIGFTFHRKMLTEPKQINKFIDNVIYCDLLGFKVYVKELLIPEFRKSIIEMKQYWKLKGIDFRIQDYKGYRGKTFDSKQYSNLDFMLIHNEFKHDGDMCSCRKGYKNVLIRGFDIFAGDVIACWNDPTVIGNICDDWYKSNYIITRNNGNIDVKGVDKLYRGTYPKDTWTPEIENLYPNLTRKDFNK